MPQREVHLRDYLAALRKHDFVICLSFLLILGTALAVSLRLPKTYAASALILFSQPSSASSASSTSLFQSVLSGGVDRTEMETIGQRFLTDSMLVSAIETLEDDDIVGTRFLPSIGALKRNLQTRVRSDTRYIEISLRLREDEGGERNAALLTNQLIRQMQALRSQEKRAEVDRRRGFLDDKLRELLDEANDREGAALAFVRENGSPAIWYPQLSTLLEQRARLEEELKQTERGLQAAKLEREIFSKEIGDHPEFAKLSETVSQDALWRYERERLADLESQRIGLEHRVGENSPAIKGLDAQIKDLKNKLKDAIPQQAITATTEGPSPLYAGLYDRLISLEVTVPRAENSLTQIRSQLQAANAELEALVKDVPENEMFLEKLQREIGAIDELRKEIHRQRLEAEMLLVESSNWSSGSDPRRVQGGIETVDAAAPQKIPVSPRIQIVVIIAGVLGCVVGIAIALFIEYFGNLYRSVMDVQSELNWLYLGKIAARSEGDPTALALSEDYRTIAANIDLSQPDIEKQALIVASCELPDQVSEVTANLGVALASVKGPVLIIDGNLSRPTQHQIFEALLESRDPEVIPGDDPVDWSRVIQKTHIPNLDLLSPARFSESPADFLRLPNLQLLFQELRRRYASILIGTPPILPTADGLILSVHCDAVALVVDLDHTTRETLQLASDRLQNVRMPVVGFIETRGGKRNAR